jgi:hypothetical protein
MLKVLDVFRSALRVLNSSDIDSTEVTVTVDRTHVTSFVADPNTRSESEPLLNCVVAGKTLNFRLSGFNHPAEPYIEDGVFLLLDDDGIEHGLRFYLETMLQFRSQE